MFYQDHLARALLEQRDDFARFCHSWNDDARECARRLQRVLELGSVDDINRAAQSGAAHKGPGALLSAEFEQLDSALLSFTERWHTHEDARRWALEILRDRVTFAADGSQFAPGRDLSIPTAAVQIAAFENYHSDVTPYRKEVSLFVISPRELLEGYGDDAQWTPESVVAFRRFEEEIKALGRFVEKQAGWRERGERAPIGFFDGTFLISYARPRNPLMDRYIEAVLGVVRLSRERKVPIVGFIDQSYARDIINLVDALSGGGGGGRSMYDTQMLRAETEGRGPLIKSWGDRTPFFLCAREGLKNEFNDERGEPLVGFIYLQTTMSGAPARLDLPAWIYEAGLLEEVVDAIRAECVVGNGYPYPLETADAAAVISVRDRERFLRAIQDFAERENVDFTIARKPASKMRRR